MTRTRESLNTKTRAEAEQLVAEINDALRAPQLKLHAARLAAVDSALVKKTWNDALDEIIRCRRGRSLERWKT